MGMFCNSRHGHRRSYRWFSPMFGSVIHTPCRNSVHSAQTSSSFPRTDEDNSGGFHWRSMQMSKAVTYDSKVMARE